MRRWSVALSVFVLALGIPGARAQTLDEVVAKHIAAHGGAEAWAKIQTMKLTGECAAFSLRTPFTMYRKRDKDYYVDHTWNGHRIIIGSDGKTIWSDNAFADQGAVELTGADLAVQQGELWFVTPIFEYPKNGYQATLLGPAELDGVPALALELTRPDGAKEKWYLDPKTYLEMGRESPGSDFGRPMPQRTYYDDFRKVSNVVIPYRVESQWYTRERIFNVKSVELNVPVDDSIFKLPPPPGMGPVTPLVGKFQVATSQRDNPQAPWAEGKRDSSVASAIGGALLEERFSADGSDVVRTLSYDRFRKRYRLTEISTDSRTMDVEEGELADGKITLSNEKTGTTLEMFGTTIHTKTVIHDITPDGFTIDRDVSTDGGKSWFTAAKAVYTRAKE
jgi:hypothetical protein